MTEITTNQLPLTSVKDKERPELRLKWLTRHSVITVTELISASRSKLNETTEGAQHSDYKLRETQQTIFFQHHKNNGQRRLQTTEEDLRLKASLQNYKQIYEIVLYTTLPAAYEIITIKNSRMLKICRLPPSNNSRH